MKNPPVNSLVALIMAGLLWAFYFFDPGTSSFFPACYFKKFTGFDCPGCGGQRALHDLLHFRFREAVDHNLLFVAGSPLLGFAAFNAFFSKKKYHFKPTILWWSCLAAGLFWLVRNLPIEELAWLRA